MAIANPTDELSHLELARHLEAHLSQENFSLLWEAFYSPESSSRRIQHQGFVSVVRRIVITPTTSSVVLEYLGDSPLTSWFHALDVDSNGWVEWADLEAAISLAATMRKCPPEYEKPSKLTSSSVYFPGGFKALWIPEWKRSIVCQHNASAPRLCNFSATPVASPLEGGHTSPIIGVTFLRATKTLVTFGCDRRLCVWDHRKGTPLLSLTLPFPATAACYDKARQWNWIATTDGKLTAYDAQWERIVVPPSSSQTHTDWVQDMMYLEELNTVITASLDRSIGFWDSTGRLVSKKVGHSRGVHRLVYAGNARVLFSSGQGKEICAWNPFSLDESPSHVLQGHEREVIALIPDVCNRALTSVDASARVVVWDTQRFVKIQVLDLAALMMSMSSIIAVWQAPLTRELLLLTVDHAYRVRSTLESSRSPRLGHRVRHVIVVESARVVVVALSHSLLLFDLIDGTLLQLLDRPFGATTKLMRLYTYDALGLLCVQLDTGRTMIYHLTSVRPLPPQITPTALPLRLQASSSTVSSGVYEPWAGVQWSSFTHRNRVTMHRLAVVGCGGTCWTQCYTNDEDALHLAANPTGTFTTIPNGQHGDDTPPSPVALIARAVFAAGGGNDAAILTANGDVLMWSISTNVVQPLHHHRVGQSVSSRVIDAMFLQNRNALLLLRHDGFTILNVGSWTPLVDVLYDDFPDLTDELVTSRDAAAAAHLSSCCDGADSTNFSLLRLHNLFPQVGASKEELWVETNYIGRVVVIYLEDIFQEFFGMQSTAIGEEEESSSGEAAIASRSVAHAVRLPGNMAKWFLVQQCNVHASATGRIHRAVDTRNKEPVMVKIFTDRKRFMVEYNLRIRDSGPSSPTAGSPSVADRGWDQLAPRSGVTLDEPSACAEGLGVWCVRTIALDEAAVRRIKAEELDAILAQATSRGGSGPMPTSLEPDEVRRSDEAFSAVIAMEMGEQSLQECMPLPRHAPKPTLPGIASVGGSTVAEAPRFVMTPEEVDVAVACLVNITAAVQRCERASMDLRPRSVCKVGDVWKYCGVDSLVENGALHVDPVPAAYCPPELCALMSTKVGADKEGPSITKRLVNPTDASCSSTCTIEGNMWTIAVIAWELQMKKRLFDQATRVLVASKKEAPSAAITSLFGAQAHPPAASTEEALLLYNFVRSCDEEWLASVRADVPPTTAAGVLVQMALHRDPARRASPAAVLLALQASHLDVQLDRLFTRPSCFRRGVENALPRRVASTVKTMEISTRGHPSCTAAVDLPNCALMKHACAVPCALSLVCCDADPTRSNEGVLHLYSCTGQEHGYLPPPEFGDREGNTWMWPIEKEVLQRNDAKVLAAEATPSDSTGPSAIKSSFVQPLQPPQGWQQMSVDQLTGTMKQTETSHLRHGIDAAVETFAVGMARKTPFFRGGQVDGDPMPLYAPTMQRIGGPRHAESPTIGGSSHKSKAGGNEATLRKWQRYWATVQRQMEEEVGLTPTPSSALSMSTSSSTSGGAGRHAPASYSLNKDFLRSVPSISHGQSMLPLVAEEIEEMLQRTDWMLQDVAISSAHGKELRMMPASKTRKPRSKQSQGVVDDALRTYGQRQHLVAKQKSEFTFTDNNLSSMDFHARTQVQSRLSSRLSPIPMEQTDSEEDELDRVERDLQRAQERSQRREHAKQADLRRRGLAPLAVPSCDNGGSGPKTSSN